MKKRTSSLPVLVVVAVVALVLGSFGTATAAGLTKGQVKKIAAKVVKKQAPTLSVAHAKTADTATNATNATLLTTTSRDRISERVIPLPPAYSGCRERQDLHLPRPPVRRRTCSPTASS